MAYDDRFERARWRDEERGVRRGTRPQRLGDRNRRESDDPDYGLERYGGEAPEGYGAGSYYGLSGDPNSIFGAPGYEPGGGSRMDQFEFGSAAASPSRSGYGITPGGYGSSARRFAELGRHGDHPHYSEWRNRQIDQLDRDYDEYRREHQARFDREFGAWRTRRGEQRAALGRVVEHMEVVGSDGGHVGTVDKVRGDSLILTRSDPNAGGHHHAIPCGWIDSVDDKVKLDLSADEAQERWRHEERGRAMFERERDRSRGPHILNRSFAGTYRDEE